MFSSRINCSRKVRQSTRGEFVMMSDVDDGEEVQVVDVVGAMPIVQASGTLGSCSTKSACLAKVEFSSLVTAII